MNSWLRIRRLRGPAFVILVGITALLNQWGVLSFSRSWPLYLILAGVFGLAERAVLAASPVPPSPYQPAVTYPPVPYAGSGYSPVAGYPASETAGNDPLTDRSRRP